MFWFIPSFLSTPVATVKTQLCANEDDFLAACKLAEEHGISHTRSLARRFEQANITVLGDGCYGVVIDGGDCAIKFIDANDAGYRAFLDLCEGHPSDYLPEIFWTEMVTDKIMAVAMEKLEPVSVDYDDDGYEIIHHEMYPILRAMMHKLNSPFANEYPELAALLAIMDEQLYGIQKASKKDIYIGDDMHSGNVMLRGEHLVITDPWC